MMIYYLTHLFFLPESYKDIALIHTNEANSICQATCQATTIECTHLLFTLFLNYRN